MSGDGEKHAEKPRIVIISGLSGSGKSVALRALEDMDFYCVDNIPANLLNSLIRELSDQDRYAQKNIGIGLDARNPSNDMGNIPLLIKRIRSEGMHCDVIFLQADESVMLTRFSNTRRKHPLTNPTLGLEDAIAYERELLGPIINAADLVIDTSRTSVYELREQVRERVGPRDSGKLSIQIESFGYKHGLPENADFVFDVRCLPNPFWEPKLQSLTGRDQSVIDFLLAHSEVVKMVDDISQFLINWLPKYENFQRAYLTVAIGCTGGQHRSVYVTDEVARRLNEKAPGIRVRHNELLDRTVVL